MTWPALPRETTMKIKVVKKGTTKVKKTLECPFFIDDPSLPQK